MILPELVDAVQGSDVARIDAMKETIKGYDDPWQIHLSLFPAVQRVLNPPFINPHLPKMYNICRDFVPYLSKEGIGSLVYLELVEYARRAKIEEATAKAAPRSKVDFIDIEKAIEGKDRERATMLLGGFLEQQGRQELVRRLLLLGSGYLEQSLGHSVSCTAFILRELIERPGIDAGPVLFLLADYFCQGGFHTTPPSKGKMQVASLGDLLSRSTTGTGFIDLHHTITLYAMERTRSFFTPEEHNHMIAEWLDFVGGKQEMPLSCATTERVQDYALFYSVFSKLDARLILDLTGGMIQSPADRSRLCSFLCTAVCDLYQGSYDPHFLTGLGSLLLLWVIDTCHDDIVLVQKALYQYLSFYFRNMRSEG
jgi:hypothetical protein